MIAISMFTKIAGTRIQQENIKCHVAFLYPNVKL